MNIATCSHCAWRHEGEPEEVLAEYAKHLLFHPNNPALCRAEPATTGPRGRYANLCDEHAAEAKKGHSGGRLRTEPESVAVTVSGAELMESGHASLTDLARTLDIAQMNLKVARGEYRRALEDMREAIAELEE